MKKVYIFMLACVIALLAACGDSNNTDSVKQKETVSKQEVTDESKNTQAKSYLNLLQYVLINY